MSRRKIVGGATACLLLATVVLTGGAGSATAQPPEPDRHGQGPHCAPARPTPPSDAEIRENYCRNMDAGDVVETREYMLSGEEVLNGPEPSEAGNTTWLTNHCAATLNDSAPPLTASAVDFHTIASFAYKDNPSTTSDDLTAAQKDDFRVKIRQELKGADRVIHQSGNTGDMYHRRVACSKDSAGLYDKIAVRFFNIYSDRTGDSVVNCSDVTNYIQNTAPYNDPNIRHMVYVHTSIDGPSGDYCNYKTGDTRYSSAPGVSNPANSTWSVALSESWETDGIGGYSVAVTNQELGHTHGLVAYGDCSDTNRSACPPGVEAGADGIGSTSHTYDWPDFMNGGGTVTGNGVYYGRGYTPPAGYRAQTNCESESKAVFGTTSDLWEGAYVDCGRDTYWNPAPAGGTWLCTHYNYATDSPYFNKRYSRSASCPAV